MEKSVKEISVAIFWGGFCPLWGENKVNDNYIQCNINRVNIILIFQLYIYIYMPYLDGSDIINKLVLWYTPDIYSRMRPIKTIWCRIFWKGWKAAIGFLKWRCLIKKKRGGGGGKGILEVPTGLYGPMAITDWASRTASKISLPAHLCVSSSFSIGAGLGQELGLANVTQCQIRRRISLGLEKNSPVNSLFILWWQLKPQLLRWASRRRARSG